MNSNNENRMTATFTYTNIVPQFSDLNREAWRLAEIAIRERFVNEICNDKVRGTHPTRTYPLTGTVRSQMYLGYDNFNFDEVKDKNIYPQFCNEEDKDCDTKYKVNVPAYMWTAGACYDLSGNCKTFSVLAKNDGHENSVGFYSLDTLEKFLGANVLTFSTCWTNKNYKRDSMENLIFLEQQKKQRYMPLKEKVTLFPGCTKKKNTDHSQELVKYFKSKSWSHFLHSYISPYVKNKREQLWQKLETAKQNHPTFSEVLEDIQKAVGNLDTIVESDLTSIPPSNCDY